METGNKDKNCLNESDIDKHQLFSRLYKSYLLITQESTSCTLMAFLKRCEFVFQLYVHLLLLEKQQGG